MFNGVSRWSTLPLSPKLILPAPSFPKHIENEFAAIPSFANTLGTDMSSKPSPKSPFGAAPSWNTPVWTWPQLLRNCVRMETQRFKSCHTKKEEIAYPKVTRARIDLEFFSFETKWSTSSTRTPVEEVPLERYLIWYGQLLEGEAHRSPLEHNELLQGTLLLVEDALGL